MYQDQQPTTVPIWKLGGSLENIKLNIKNNDTKLDQSCVRVDPQDEFLCSPDIEKLLSNPSCTSNASLELFAVSQSSLSASRGVLSLTSGSLPEANRQPQTPLPFPPTHAPLSTRYISSVDDFEAVVRSQLDLDGSSCSSVPALSCGGSLLGSSAFLEDLEDSQFSVGSRDKAGSSGILQQVNLVSSVWSRDDEQNPCRASLGTFNSDHLTSAATTSSPSNNKRLLPSTEYRLASKPTTRAPPVKRATYSDDRRVAKWTEAEDERLKEGVQRFGLPNWVPIARHVKTRNNKMCAQRWRNCLRPEVTVKKMGKWSQDEDDQLRNVVSKYGGKDSYSWEQIAKDMDFNRNSKQCRERWSNFLDPSLRRGPWTKQEDECVITLHDQFGKAWKSFTQQLSGRSADQIRRRFHYLKAHK